VMKVGDRVTRDSVLRTENPEGSIIKINNDYVVVKWEGLPGQWYYTHEQTDKLTIVMQNSLDKSDQNTYNTGT